MIQTFLITAYNKALPPYLTLSINANVQRVSLTSGAIYDRRRAFGVEVIALCQAVQRTGLHTTWVTQKTHKQSTLLSEVHPALRKQTA